jgi:hypothetical protein
VVGGFLDVEAVVERGAQSMFSGTRATWRLLDDTLALKDELFQISLEDQVIVARID